MLKNTSDIILYKYQDYSQEADGVAAKTLDGRMYSLRIYIEKNPNLKKLSPAKAKQFKQHLKDIRVDGKTLSLKRQRRILGNIQAFLRWLRMQPGYKKAIPEDLISYYSLTNKENRLANISKTREYPSLKHVLKLIKGIV